MAHEISSDRLVFTYPNDEGELGEDIKVDFGFSEFSDLTEKKVKGKVFYCPLLLSGGHVPKKCNSGHQHKGGYLFRHLESKGHPGVPSTWKAYWKVDT